MTEPQKLEPPVGAGASAIKEWVTQQIKAGVPRGFILRALCDAHFSEELEDLDEMLAVSKAEDQLSDPIVTRNLEGKEAEHAGNEERAMVLYEANVSDRSDGSHPYERLRIIYARRGQFRDAIRVCKTYLQDVAQNPDLCRSYQKYIVKYQAKMEATEGTQSDT